MVTGYFQKRANQLLIIFSIILLAGLLAVLGIKGTFSRYAQDDYCYGYRVRNTGFWNTQIQSYLVKPEFVSDRFSTTLAHSIVEKLGGPKFVPFLTFLEILAWLGGLIYIFYQLQALMFSKRSWLIMIASALVILFFTLYMSPNQYQILYWLSAMQTYLTPMILATFLLGRFTAISRSSSLKLRHGIELGILSFFAGGFSETTGLWLFTCWCILFGWSFILRNRSALIKNASRLSLVAMLSTGLALVVMAISPSNNIYRPFTDPALFEMIIRSLEGGMAYIRVSLKVTPLPYFIVICFGFWLCSLTQYERKGSVKKYLFEILATVLILYVFAVANMVPIKVARLPTSWPGARSLFPAHFSLVVCLFVFGWKSANLIMALKSDFFSFHLSKILLTLLGIALIIYVAHTTPRVYDKIQLYAARAKAWDARDRMILEAKADGQVDVTVPQFDSVYNITELKPESYSWVNICAAKYYGMKSITAIEDYQGIPANPIGK